ncbi:MAG: hypothetical protein ACP5NV_00175 [Candidatus Woesearchaeota archaeon]
MDNTINRYLKNDGVNTGLDIRTRVNIPPRNLGIICDGVTIAESMYFTDTWKMPANSFEEYKKFIEDVENIGAKRLMDSDMTLVNGDTFRGTDVFLLTLALYTKGLVLGIRDYSVNNSNTRKISMNYALSTSQKKIAVDYANKYVETNGTIADSFKKIEEQIFNRVLSDNDAKEIPMPDFMLQPIIIGLGKHYRDNIMHKKYEGKLIDASPNISTLNLLARLKGDTPEEFYEKYPILSSNFKR